MNSRRTLLVLKMAVGLALLSESVRPSRAGIFEDEPQGAGRLTRLSMEELGNIAVTTASKVPVKLMRTPAAIYVITGDDIRRSGVTSIPEALRLAPGVQVARIDSSKWAIGVRGFGSRLSRGVLVLIDGRSVYTTLFAGVFWEVQDTLLEDVDRIEVIRGPGGTIWGANAVNAVINIITRSTKETQGTLVTAGGGNVDQGFLGFRSGGGNGRDFNYRVYGKGFTRSPQFHSDRRQYDDWRMGQSGFRTDWEFRGRDSLTLQGDLYSARVGEKLALTSYTPPFTSNVEQNAVLSGGNLTGRWKRTLGDGGDVQVQAYYDRTNREAANFREVRNTFDVDFLHRMPLPRHEVLWGLGARISSGDTTQVVPSVIFTPRQRTDKLFSAFVQDEIAVVPDRLSLTVGSKFLHNNYTGFEIEPTARVLWTPTERQTVWAAVTRAVRTPSRVEEDLQIFGLITTTNGLATFLRLDGNKDFRAERLIGYEVGYRHLVSPNFFVDFASFHNNYDRLLGVEPAGNPFVETSPTPPHVVIPFSLRNSVVGRTTGLEIAPDWKPTGWWRLQGSYSFLHLDLKSRPGSTDLSTARSIERSSPNHQVVVQSSMDLRRNVEIQQTFRFSSAVPAQQVGAYATVDLRLGWRPAEKIEVSIIGQNLLQPHHFEFGGNPGGLVGIKRAVYAKITWQK